MTTHEAMRLTKRMERQEAKLYKKPRNRGVSVVIYMPRTPRMQAFKVALRVAAAVRQISPPQLMLEIAYAALHQWGELPEAALNAMEDYKRPGQRTRNDTEKEEGKDETL